MSNSWHVEWLKEGVKSWNRRRKKVAFSPDLSGVFFFDLLPRDFRDSPKTSRFFENIDLSNANLSGADLSSLNFSGAKFSNSDLSHSKLTLSNFQKAKFKATNLSSVFAEKAFFEFAEFENCNFTEASLTGSNFENAVIINSELNEQQINELETAPSEFFSNQKSYLDSKRSKNIDSIQIISNLKAASTHSAIIEKEDNQRTKKIRYDVFYATNRKPIYNRGELADFGGEKNGEINYGISEVIIPDSHRVGSIGSPRWKKLINRKDDRLHIESIISLNEELFWRHIRTSSEKMKIKEHPTIFVHGYNVLFSDAVKRAAQLGHDLGLAQGIGLFSWPSKGRIRSYSADESSSESSKYLLAEYINTFTSNSEKGRINIIAHSMGCRCLIGALEVLANGRTGTLKKINQVILAAADIDSDAMPYQIRKTLKYCTRTTSYISDQDNALRISGWLHEFPRIGITPPTFVMEGLDTVLVNDLKVGATSHGYLGENRSVLNDIHEIIKRNTNPVDRFSIEPVLSEFGNYWKIKN